MERKDPVFSPSETAQIRLLEPLTASLCVVATFLMINGFLSVFIRWRGDEIVVLYWFKRPLPPQSTTPPLCGGFPQRHSCPHFGLVVTWSPWPKAIFVLLNELLPRVRLSSFLAVFLHHSLRDWNFAWPFPSALSPSGDPRQPVLLNPSVTIRPKLASSQRNETVSQIYFYSSHPIATSLKLKRKPPPCRPEEFSAVNCVRVSSVSAHLV